MQKPHSDNFGDYLFRDLRYRADGSENSGFLLNLPAYQPAKIVVAKENFACGSSREHAVWALYDYGVRVVIAPSVEIFRLECIEKWALDRAAACCRCRRNDRQDRSTPGMHVIVDLDAQTVSMPDGVSHGFDIDPYQKRCLKEGLDELGYTLTQLERIEAFERSYAY